MSGFSVREANGELKIISKRRETDLDEVALIALLGCGCRCVPKAYRVMVADKAVWL